MVVNAFWSYCCFVCLEQQLKSITNKIFRYCGCKMNILFSEQQYRTLSVCQAAILKLLFWVLWYIMLLMCFSLKELSVILCDKMTDRGLLEGIGSLHELTSLLLHVCDNVTAQAWSKFLHRPSMNSMVLLQLSYCCNLDDEGLKGIANRCNNLTFLLV